VTTVHHLQVVDEALPETEHDFSVDLIVTPGEVIECGPPRRPGGLYWEHLTEDKIAAIPVLAAGSCQARLTAATCDIRHNFEHTTPRNAAKSCGQRAVKQS
jgi:hypothetical protein